MKTSPRGLCVALTIVVLLGASVPVEAQGPPAVFADLPGLSETQREMAAAIQSVCGRLAPLELSLRGRTADLFQRCREMVHTSNAIQGSGATTFSLGLNAAGLAEVVSAAAPDEVTSQGTLSSDIGSPQFRLLVPRLAALRRGATGVTMDLDISGTKVAVDGGSGRLPAGGASADTGGRGLGAFLNAGGAFGDKDSTSREVGFDFYSLGVLGGVDYRFMPNFVAGVALGYDYTDADYDNLLGDAEAHTYSGTLYATYYVGPWYLDAHGGFAWNEYETTRRIVYPGVNRTAFGDTDGQQYTVGLGTGYAIPLGPVTITPTARAEYLHLDIDGYSESGASGLNLTIRDQELDSFQTALGAAVRYSISLPFGVLVPQVSAEWRHEFLNDERSVTAKYSADPFNTFFSIPTDDPDRDFFAVAVGLSAGFARGVSAFVNYETILGLRHITHHDFRGGVRVEF